MLAILEMASPRRDVLALYRQILRLSQTWIARDPTSTSAEQQYIKQEAKTQFRKNMDLADAQTIKDALHEGQARVEIALHYRNPYPRPVNVPPKTLALKQGHHRTTDSNRFDKLG